MEPSMNIDGDHRYAKPLLGSHVASMEPSMNIDGDVEQRAAEYAMETRFNGAVDEHRRRPARS